MSPCPPSRPSGSDQTSQPSRLSVPRLSASRLSPRTSPRRRPLKNVRLRPRRRVSSSAIPPLAIRLSIQGHADHTPMPLDLYVSYEKDSNGAHIQVFPPRTHRPGSIKRSSAVEDDVSRPAKRPHIETLRDDNQVETWTDDSDDSDDLDLAILPHTRISRQDSFDDTWPVEWHAEGLRAASPSYIADLGLIKTFPTSSHDDRAFAEVFVPGYNYDSSSGDGFDSSDGNSNIPSESDVDGAVSISPSGTLMMRLVSMVSVLFIVSPCLFLIQILMALATRLFASPPRSAIAVGWFSRASKIEMGLASVPRLMLFGHAGLEPDCWKCQAGMKRFEGKIDDLEPIASEWFSDSVLYPAYRPWESTSNGTFVPESYFFDDIQHVLHSTLVDLETIASHGPSSFRLKPGNTRSYTSLPTFAPNCTHCPSSKSTTPGVKDSCSRCYFNTSTEYSLSVYNSELSLAQLKYDLVEAFGILSQMRSTVYAMLPTTYLESARNRARYVTLLLEKLRLEAVKEDSNWGSDQDRMRCLYPPRPSGEIPDLYEKEGLIQVLGAQCPFPSQLKEWEASSSTETSLSPSQPPCLPTGLKTPNEWSDAQERNITAHKLLHHINIAIDMNFRGGLHNDDILPSYSDILAWGGQLVVVCDLMGSLNDQVQQVMQGLPNDGGLNRSVNRLAEDAIHRIHDVGHFFDEIALVRLRKMRDMASSEVSLMKEMKRQATQLQNGIDYTVMDGWLTDDDTQGHEDVLNYFPAIHDIMEQWKGTYEWIAQEYADINKVYTSRMAEFVMHRQQEKDAASWAEHSIIWSRWALRDSRIDPVGTEALCWNHGPLKATNGTVVDSRGHATRCGDATARHG
ncbi:hypothetical protein EDB81DRAFT_768996 [Dactylonectria macrodidyma]|uniref:Uncharacterized protein n=1 Tax=Dactylonectria macrodidyma TaxID=307937 RepID=A0A9P9CZY9_9HYPO|nr:hypothetical protein EDB81DRAFT_768996 [Dactylonectria macrodidyma]